MSKKILFVSLFSTLFFFSACQKADVEKIESITGELTEFSSLPAQSFSCKDLKTDFYRNECEQRLNQVAGEILAGEVLSTYDLNRCSQLPHDQVEHCKNSITSSGIKGPLSLVEVESLNQALQAVYPALSPEQYANMTEQERENLQPEYKKESCRVLTAEKGLKAYCEAQIQEKLELDQLKESLMNAEPLDCSSFTRPRVIEECQRVRDEIS